MQETPPVALLWDGGSIALSEDEWTVLSTLRSLGGFQGATAQLVSSGGDFGPAELGELLAFTTDARRRAREPLQVHRTLREGDERFFELVHACRLRYTKRVIEPDTHEGVFRCGRRVVNPGATPQTLGDVPQFESLLEKLEFAVASGLRSGRLLARIRDA